MPRKAREAITKEQFEIMNFVLDVSEQLPMVLTTSKTFSQGNQLPAGNVVILSLKSVCKKANIKPMKMSKKNEVLSRLVSDISDGILSLLNEIS